MQPLKIYVAGPTSAATRKGILANVEVAKKVTVELMKKGHYPYTPHLLCLLEHDQPWEFWMAFDEQWLRCCDALFYIAPSPGTDIELALAKELGMYIFYSLDEVEPVGSLGTHSVEKRW